MSYNKNTQNFSDIDTIIEILTDLGIDYQLEEIGKIKALGVNDDYNNIEEYTLHRLTYNDFVILEQMYRDPDCDADDLLESYKFPIKDEPKNWSLEIYGEEEEYSSNEETIEAIKELEQRNDRDRKGKGHLTESIEDLIEDLEI